jgi:dynein heavy chain
MTCFSAQYETIVVRHGLMLVGPTGGGKTSNLKVLKNTLTALKRKGEKGFAYEKVHIYQMNPKAIRMGQLYGEFDANTHEWEDGILCSLYRVAGSFYLIDWFFALNIIFGSFYLTGSLYLILICS